MLDNLKNRRERSVPELPHVAAITERFLKHRALVLLVSVVMLIILVSLTWLVVSTSQQKLIEYKSLQIASVVAAQATTARSLYSKSVVAKLKRDGFSASTQSEDITGSVPIPAQFLKELAHDSSERSGGSYKFRPLSKWNLSPDQGLKDDFQRWAWSELEQQNKNPGAGPIAWEPVWRIEMVDNIQTLRYLVADPAASQSCVNCHNVMEQLPETKARRLQAGVDVGKTWQLNELMGALEVLVPVNESSEFAATQTKNGLMLILGVTLFGALLVAGLSALDRARTNTLTNSLKQQALTDKLTALPNRAGFDAGVTKLLSARLMEDSEHAMMLLDLNGFKRINDTLGHEIGDEVLIETARRLTKVVVENGVIARLGGDEFALFIPECTPEQAEAVASEIATAFSSAIEIEEYRLQSRPSIGIAMMPKDGTSLREITRCADVAMYVSKKSRSKLAFYCADEDQNHLTLSSLINDFKQALHSDQLTLVYQPKFDLRAGRVSGVEAFLRWEHPQHGMIPPRQIVAMAENSGEIQQLTRWSLDTGLTQLHQWRLAGYDLSLSINLSAKMLHRQETVLTILQSLSQAKIPANKLIIEVTEMAMMEDPNYALQLLNQLDQAGVVLSIDDFGTGYSSLSYIHNLPLRELKLDRSFVAGLGDIENDSVVAKTSIELAANLGLDLVAEGVEDQDALVSLAAMNCKVAQGFFLWTPNTAEQITDQFSTIEKRAIEITTFLTHSGPIPLMPSSKKAA